MNIADYLARFPGEKVWCAGRSDNQYRRYYGEGMIRFDEDSAYCWAGPFNKEYAYYCLYEGKHLLTEQEHRQRYRWATYNFPYRFRKMYANNATSEEQFQLRWAKLTEKERTEFDRTMELFELDTPTVEKPVAFYLCGTDDSSYTKFYATANEALEDLALLVADQPCNFNTHVRDFGFIFTN